MFDINNITIEEFKALFSRDFPYLPLWKYGKIYFVDDIVYSKDNFYKSNANDNSDEPPSSKWDLINENPENYILDGDIQKAFAEAKMNFNPKLFTSCEGAKTAFCYLTAHYLVIDLNNASNPFSLGGMGITQSKSVGSVSESYGIPEWVMRDKNLSLYAQTGYGRKYLSLVLPRLHGNIIFTKGFINFG